MEQSQPPLVAHPSEPATAEILSRSPDGSAFLILIWKESKVDLYDLHSYHLPGGNQHFRFIKDDGEVHDVEVTGESYHCDCKGYERWQRCKHREALLDLAQQEEERQEESIEAPICPPSGYGLPLVRLATHEDKHCPACDGRRYVVGDDRGQRLLSLCPACGGQGLTKQP